MPGPEDTYEGPAVDPAAAPQEPDLRCHRCGAPHDRFQEYCLECGARLAQYPPQFSRWGGSPYWFWASLLALLAIALVTAAVVIAATNDDEKSGSGSEVTGPLTSIPSLPTTIPLTSTELPTSSVSIPSVSTTSLQTTTFSTVTTSTAATTTTAPTTTTTSQSELTQWPSGESGWTVILASVPESEGKPAAESKARAAKQKGLPQCGVLLSTNYEGLTPSLWVVFSGVYDTKSQADAHVSSAKQAGYSSAYVRQIVPK